MFEFWILTENLLMPQHIEVKQKLLSMVHVKWMAVSAERMFTSTRIKPNPSMQKFWIIGFQSF